MAMANVIPELWSTTIVEPLKEELVGAGICNMTIASRLNSQGDQFHIPLAADVSTSAYTEASTTITYEDPTDTVSTLTIDQDQYAAIKLSDEEILQAGANWQTAYAMRMAHNLADDIDEQILAQYASAGTISYETGTTDWTLGADGSGFPTLIAALHRILDNANASKRGRFVVLPSNAIEAYRLHVGAKATALGDEVTRNGVVGQYFGMDIIHSNNLTNETSTNHGLAGVRSDSIACAIQVDPSNIESLRLEGKFATGIRARAKWGSVVYRPATLIDVSLNEALLA